MRNESHKSKLKTLLHYVDQWRARVGSREAVALADGLPGGGPKVLDASTAYRVDPAWTYALFERRFARSPETR